MSDNIPWREYFKGGASLLMPAGLPEGPRWSLQTTATGCSVRSSSSVTAAQSDTRRFSGFADKWLERAEARHLEEPFEVIQDSSLRYARTISFYRTEAIVADVQFSNDRESQATNAFARADHLTNLFGRPAKDSSDDEDDDEDSSQVAAGSLLNDQAREASDSADESMQLEDQEPRKAEASSAVNWLLSADDRPRAARTASAPDLRFTESHSEDDELARWAVVPADTEQNADQSQFSSLSWLLSEVEDPDDEKVIVTNFNMAQAIAAANSTSSKDPSMKVHHRVELKAMISMTCVTDARVAMCSNDEAFPYDDSEFGNAEYDEQLQEEIYCSALKAPGDLAMPKAVASLPREKRVQGDIAGNSQRMPVKHGFIHFDTPTLARQVTPRIFTRCLSAPGIMMSRPFALIKPSMETIHLRRDCRPCAYHQQKEDGCRWGAECKFCHLCPPGEIKKRKKEKLRARRVQPWSRASATASQTLGFADG